MLIYEINPFLMYNFRLQFCQRKQLFDRPELNLVLCWGIPCMNYATHLAVTYNCNIIITTNDSNIQIRF